jgi:hypothetical protein
MTAVITETEELGRMTNTESKSLKKGTRLLAVTPLTAALSPGYYKKWRRRNGRRKWIGSGP